MILMYHKVHPDAPSMWWVTVDAFYRQMHALRHRQVVFLDNYDPGNPDHVVITFDGVYRNVLTYALPLLQSFGYPFELFVSGNHIGQSNAFDEVEPNADFCDLEALKKLVQGGGRLQWHTRSHRNLGTETNRSVIEAEFDIPTELREADPSGFGWVAYPHGDFNELTLSIARQCFRGGVSCHQGNDSDRLILNRLTVTDNARLPAPTASLVIASFNYGRFLVEAIESALRQTIPFDEILISDDASSDDTWDIAESYRQRFPELIRTNRNAFNMGIVEHFNKAVNLTSGDYVCILGADNRLRSDYLEKTTVLLNQNPDAAIAYTDFALFGPRARITAQDMQRFWQTETLEENFEVVRFPDFNGVTRQLLRSNNFIHGTSLFRREAFRAVGGYLSTKPLPEDHGLFLRMVEAGWSACHAPYPLLEYRQHSRDQANVNVVSESQLHYYREQHQRALEEIAALQRYISIMRSSLSWKLATPFRVAEHLIRKWLRH